VYPDVLLSSRTRAATVLPLSAPIKGTTINEIQLPKNTNVIIGIGAANRDPAIWGEDADEWKPDRWLGKGIPEVAREKLPGVYSGM